MNSELAEEFKLAIAQQDMNGLINLIPYSALIGINSEQLDGDFIFSLPSNADNIGNPKPPAIHGGVIAGFMENCAALYTIMQSGRCSIPKIIDISFDYLRPGKSCDSYARCKIVKKGRKIANISITCWQSSEDLPIATARAHYLTE